MYIHVCYTLAFPDSDFDLGRIQFLHVGPQVAVEDIHQQRLEHHVYSDLDLCAV